MSDYPNALPMYGRQWNGFPSGIETNSKRDIRDSRGVASGMASRQGLKRTTPRSTPMASSGRQWNGFPSGIETKIEEDTRDISIASPVEWLPVRD